MTTKRHSFIVQITTIMSTVVASAAHYEIHSRYPVRRKRKPNSTNTEQNKRT